MKKALTLLLIYFLICLLGTSALATLFMFNADSMHYVIDVPSSLFSLETFLYGMSIAFPLVSIASLVSLVLIMVRNQKNQLPCFITYIILSALTWIVFIPFSLTQLSVYDSAEHEQTEQKTSAGIFRPDSNGILYYSRVLENGNTDGIFIDSSGYLGQEGNIISFYDSPVRNSQAYPYSDVLIKNALQPPLTVTYPLSLYISLLTSALHYNESGFLAWLCFASLGLAFASIYSFQYFSEWKLSSALSVLIAAAFIIFINYFCYMDYLPAALKQFGKMLSDFTSAENPLVIVLNLITAIVFSIYGIIMKIYRLKKTEVVLSGDEL